MGVGGKKDFSTGKTNIVGQGHAHMCTCARLYHETYIFIIWDL